MPRHEPTKHRVSWVSHAIQTIEADHNRSGDTHLLKPPMPDAWSEFQLYFKDESLHPSGSLKHRLARSLFLYGLCSGRIGPDTAIIEASSGSTAISEAYFARMLGLRFIAVVPANTTQNKIKKIAFYGGESHLVNGPDMCDEAKRIAAVLGGYFMDQFTFAERATDWRGNNNIAESLFSQMQWEPNPQPHWIVVSAGTGGTAATIGRYLRLRCMAGDPTGLCVADPENSVYYDFYHTNGSHAETSDSSRIEGIGRPRVEKSFIPSVIDRMTKVPDAASMAALRFLERWLGRRCGGSTGTNLIAAVRLLHSMRAKGQRGSIVTLIGDDGGRYYDTYYNDEWINAQGLEVEPWSNRLDAWAKHGAWKEP